MHRIRIVVSNRFQILQRRRFNGLRRTRPSYRKLAFSDAHRREYRDRVRSVQLSLFRCCPSFARISRVILAVYVVQPITPWLSASIRRRESVYLISIIELYGRFVGRKKRPVLLSGTYVSIHRITRKRRTYSGILHWVTRFRPMLSSYDNIREKARARDGRVLYTGTNDRIANVT